MKYDLRKLKLLLCVSCVAVAMAILGQKVSCGTSLGTLTEVGTETNTLAAPSAASIVTALKANTTYGMVPGLTLSDITLPACTKSDGSEIDFTATHTLTGADWLSLHSSTRVLSLANRATTIPADANEATTVTYTCTDVSNSSVAASVEFIVNDADGGGVIDAKECACGAVPLLNDSGWFQLTHENANLYRVMASPCKVPTAITKVALGMDATNADDDSADFDGDDGVIGGGTNAEEIAAGTNPMVYSTSATFSDSGKNYVTGKGPFYITAADFDGDGNLDLAVVNQATGANNLSIFMNDGDGTFTDSGEYPETGATPRHLTVADFDGDGDIDLAVTCQDQANGNLYVFLGDGDGTFTSGENLNIGKNHHHAAAADLDGDGDVDLAVVSTNGDNLTILLGDGDGTFTDLGGTPAVGNGPRPVIAADFDGDGDIDLATVAQMDNNLSILLGNGDGTFISGGNYNVGNVPLHVIAADLDGDGDIDLVTTNRDDDNLSIFLGNGDGTFTDSGEKPNTGDRPHQVIAADLDGDGDIDLAVQSMSDDNLSILLGDGDGTFTDSGANPSTGTNSPGYDSRHICAGDFDGDGDIDLAAANGMVATEDYNLVILLNE